MKKALQLLIFFSSSFVCIGQRILFIRLILIACIYTGLVGCVSSDQVKTFPADFTYSKPEGFADSVYQGSIEVYENRTTNSGKKINLYVIIVPSAVKTKN